MKKKTNILPLMVNSLYDKNMTDKSEYLKEKYMLLGRKEEKARLPLPKVKIPVKP